jgi:hypothetical protein
MMRSAALLALFAVSTFALAKLPPPSDEAKAKAAEAAAKAAWTDKVAAYQLCKSQDKVVAGYHAEAKKEGKPTKPAVSTPPCTDPGPFVAAAPSKPLEAAGAHSPPQTATTPPSTNTPHAEQPAAKK